MPFRLVAVVGLVDAFIYPISAGGLSGSTDVDGTSEGLFGSTDVYGTSQDLYGSSDVYGTSSKPVRSIPCQLLSIGSKSNHQWI